MKTKQEREQELREQAYKKLDQRHARARPTPMDKIRQKAIEDMRIKETLEREYPPTPSK